MSSETPTIYDWAGGLLWVLADQETDVRAAMAGIAGHATLIRAPLPVRAAVDVFEPQPGPIAALSKRVKESFDPKGLFNPGRMG